MGGKINLHVTVNKMQIDIKVVWDGYSASSDAFAYGGSDGLTVVALGRDQVIVEQYQVLRPRVSACVFYRQTCNIKVIFR